MNEWMDECTPGFVNGAHAGLGLFAQRKRWFQEEGKIWKEKKLNISGALEAWQEGYWVLHSFLSFCTQNIMVFISQAETRSSERLSNLPSRVSWCSFHCSMSWENLLYFLSEPTGASLSVQKPHVAFIPSRSNPHPPGPRPQRLALSSSGGALSGLSFMARYLESDFHSSCILHLRHKCHWHYYGQDVYPPCAFQTN